MNAKTELPMYEDRAAEMVCQYTFAGVGAHRGSRSMG